MTEKITRVTIKTYNDKKEIIAMKDGYLFGYKQIQEIRNRNKEQKINSSSYKTMMKSRRRAYQKILDYVDCNNFKYFMTLTFGNFIIDRLNHSETRKAFSKWIAAIKRKDKNLKYIAVAAYKNNALHFHLLIDTAAENLGLVDSMEKNYINGTWHIIYIVGKWKYGLNSATELWNRESAKFYLANNLNYQTDIEFLGKKRYSASRNLKKPVIKKSVYPCNDEFNIRDSILIENYNIDYEDKDKGYIILSRDLHSSEQISYYQ